MKDNKELREAVEEVQPEVVAVSLRLSQSKPVYEAFQSLKEGASWSNLTEAQQRIVDKNLREFTLGGVALEVGLPQSSVAFAYDTSRRPHPSLILPRQPPEQLTSSHHIQMQSNESIRSRSLRCPVILQPCGGMILHYQFHLRCCLHC